MADTSFEDVSAAIGVLVAFYKQQVVDGELKNEDLKKKIEEIKTNPEFQEKLKRCQGKRKGRKHDKMLEKLNTKCNIGMYSRLVALMVRCQYDGQDCDDDDDDDENEA